jgi:hypothetical protein
MDDPISSATRWKKKKVCRNSVLSHDLWGTSFFDFGIFLVGG